MSPFLPFLPRSPPLGRCGWQPCAPTAAQAAEHTACGDLHANGGGSLPEPGRVCDGICGCLCLRAPCGCPEPCEGRSRGSAERGTDSNSLNDYRPARGPV